MTAKHSRRADAISTLRVWILAATAALSQLLVLTAGIRLFGGDASYLIEAHDAKFYLDQVADPFLLNPATVDGWGNISYWGLRIGFPFLGWTLHSLLGGFGALVTVNAMAAAVGSVWAARLAVDSGKSAWWGLILAVNPASAFAAGLLLPDTVAYAAVVGVLLAGSRRRWFAATLLAVLAVATKEASLAPIGLAASYYWIRGEKKASWTVLVPLAWQLGWAISLTSRYDALHSGTFVDWPFVGLVEASRRVWLTSDRVDPAIFVAAGMLLLASIAIAALVRHPSPVTAGAAGAGLVYLFLDWQVLYPISNLPRIGGWLFPLLAVAGGAARSIPLETSSANGPSSSTLKV